MAGQYTEAQKAASKKYIQEKTDEMKVRFPKGYKELIKIAAKKRNLSVNQYIISLVDNDLKKCK